MKKVNELIDWAEVYQVRVVLSQKKYHEMQFLLSPIEVLSLARRTPQA